MVIERSSFGDVDQGRRSRIMIGMPIEDRDREMTIIPNV